MVVQFFYLVIIIFWKRLRIDRRNNVQFTQSLFCTFELHFELMDWIAVEVLPYFAFLIRNHAIVINIWIVKSVSFTTPIITTCDVNVEVDVAKYPSANFARIILK